MNDFTSEQWQPVEGFPKYEVSDQGRVRSLSTKYHPGRILRPWMHTNGYWAVTLYLAGEASKIPIHRLVAAAFLGPRPEGEDVCHGRNGPLDNRASQLRYDTREGNMGDTILDGTKPQGDAHHNAKLSVVVVGECRRRVAAGESIGSLADALGVSDSTLGAAVRGITWPTCPVPPVSGRTLGPRYHQTKLTDAIVTSCRARYAAGEIVAALAREYGVSVMAMRNAVKGITWKHVRAGLDQ